MIPAQYFLINVNLSAALATLQQGFGSQTLSRRVSTIFIYTNKKIFTFRVRLELESQKQERMGFIDDKIRVNSLIPTRICRERFSHPGNRNQGHLDDPPKLSRWLSKSRRIRKGWMQVKGCQADESVLVPSKTRLVFIPHSPKKTLDIKKTQRAAIWAIRSLWKGCFSGVSANNSDRLYLKTALWD